MLQLIMETAVVCYFDLFFIVSISGPVFKKDKVIGVAFSGLDHADGIGYIIPSTIVNHFLNEYVETKQFRGFCSLGILIRFIFSNLRNSVRIRCPEHGEQADAASLPNGQGRIWAARQTRRPDGLHCRPHSEWGRTDFLRWYEEMLFFLSSYLDIAC
jgi:hypothetical protein